jgi:hypothetical protein
MSSKNSHWNTPSEILDRVRNIAPISLDPTHNINSTVNSKHTYDITKGEDALILPWGGFGLVFLNCPFDMLPEFGYKVSQEAKLGTEIVVIAPADVSTKVFQQVWMTANSVCFPDHRIVYLNEGKKIGSPRFASIIAYFGWNSNAFEEAFHDFGKIIRP